jgi:hypothetical protein
MSDPEYEAWFLEEVEKGLESARRGELIDHEEVMRGIEKRIQERKAVSRDNPECDSCGHPKSRHLNGKCEGTENFGPGVKSIPVCLCTEFLEPIKKSTKAK